MTLLTIKSLAFVATSGDIAILMKIAELVQRFGLRAYDYEAVTGYVDEQTDPDGNGYCYLRFDSVPTDPGKLERVKEIQTLLGVEDGLVKEVDDVSLEDLLNDALSRAPRARAR